MKVLKCRSNWQAEHSESTKARRKQNFFIKANAKKKNVANVIIEAMIYIGDPQDRFHVMEIHHSTVNGYRIPGSKFRKSPKGTVLCETKKKKVDWRLQNVSQKRIIIRYGMI